MHNGDVTLQLSAYCVKLVSQNSERETVEHCGTLYVEWQVSLERGEDKARKERPEIRTAHGPS